MRSRYPFYGQLLRLYPKAYRDQYASQMLQTLEDMLDDQSSRIKRAAIWVKVITELPVSLARQNIFALEHNLAYETPGFIKRSGVASAGLLLPFVGALCANAVNKMLYNQTLFHSWLWSGVVLKTWVLFLPMIAFAIAALSYVYFVMCTLSKEKKLRLLSTIKRTWPVLMPLGLAFGILMLVQFHDSAHCFLQNPLHYGTEWHRIMQCTQRS